MRRDTKQAIVLSTAGVLACLALAAVLAFASCPPRQVPFDEAVWKAVPGRMLPPNSAPRGAMLDAVRDEVLRPGMTRAEVVERLGRPDFDESDGTASGFVYCLGPTDRLVLDLDSKWLTLSFDEEDRLVEVDVVQM